MANLIPMETAAVMMGMTVEQLSELRSNSEIFGYRDGSSWKFKLSELERVADDLNVQLNMDAFRAFESSGQQAVQQVKDVPDTDVDDELDFAIDDDGDDELIQDSGEIMVDDSSSGEFLEEDDSSELIQDDSSVEIFSKPLSAAAAAAGFSEADDLKDSAEELIEDSSVEIFAKPLSERAADEVDELRLEDSGDLNLEDSGLILESGEDVLGGEEALSFGSSSLSLASDSNKQGVSPSSTGDLLDDEPAKSESPSDTGKMLGGADDDLLLSDDDLFADEIEIADSGSFDDSAELSSDFEESDLIMEDSDSSTDMVMEANDSGINLSPNESGILLEDEPLELGGSDIDSLELPEDDDMIVLDNIADSDSATVMQEDDFNLTPLEVDPEEESSGSQVIALEDSEIYTDDSAATVLGASDSMGDPGLLDDMAYAGAAAAGAATLAPVGSAGQAMGPVGLPEAPYGLWQILSLAFAASLLVIGSMIGYDICRNMWMPEDQVVNQSVLNIFLSMFGMDG